MTSPSVLTPVGTALETVRRVLFQQFNPIKWLAMGFTAWLALLGEGTGVNISHQCGKPEFWRWVWEWVQAHLIIVVPLFILFSAAGLIFLLLVLWLKCRGKFMFLDNVVKNRAEIARPWKKFRLQGNSCFLFNVCFILAALAVLILGVGLVLLVGWPDWSRSRFSWNAAFALIIGVTFFSCFIITAICVETFLEDFVIPIMAFRECRIMEGWSVFFDLFRRDAGMFILYLLFKAALGLVMGLMVILACCLLCCTVLIPYVGTVILLPIHVFWRAYSVHFLGQFDNKLKIFNGDQSSYISLSAGDSLVP